MKLHKSSPTLSPDPIDGLIRSALQEEISSVLKLPCVWRDIKKQVWRLEREKRGRWAYLDNNYVENVLPLWARVDVSYFLMAKSALQHIK